MGNKIAGFVLLKNHHEIHRAEGAEDISSVLLGVDGACWAFGAADGGVAVESDNEGISLGAGEGEVVGVASVEDVEATVGENKGSALGMETVPLGAHFRRGENAREELGEGLGGVHALC